MNVLGLFSFSSNEIESDIPSNETNRKNENLSKCKLRSDTSIYSFNGDDRLGFYPKAYANVLLKCSNMLGVDVRVLDKKTREVELLLLS